MIKIAILTPLYEPSVGGVQETCKRMAEYFASQGAQVRVYTGQRRSLDEVKLIHGTVRNFLPYQIKNGVHITRYACGGWVDSITGIVYALYYKIHLPGLQIIFNRYQMRLMRSSQVTRDIVSFKPDVLMTAPCVDPLMLISEKIIKKTQAKWFVKTSLHLSNHNEKKSLAVEMLKKVDRVLVNTENERDFLVTHGVSASVVHWPAVTIDVDGWAAVDESKVDPRVSLRLEGRRYLLYFGRKQDQKGILELVRAFEKLQKDDPELHLVIAGEETVYFKEKIRPIIHKLSNVYEYGSSDMATKKWLYKNALLFSMVSAVDSFGIVYCESWLSGRPVVAADNGQMRCVVDHEKDGLLVPYGDVDRLTETLRTLIQRPEALGPMGERGRQKVLRMFADQAVEKKVFGLIRAVIE